MYNKTLTNVDINKKIEVIEKTVEIDGKSMLLLIVVLDKSSNIFTREGSKCS